jgi:site-specific DNA recombinase
MFIGLDGTEGVEQDYYACSAARRQGTCTNRASMRRSQVELWIIEALRNQLMAPDLVAEFVREFNNEINRVRRERDTRRAGLVRELREVERRIDILLDTVASGELKGSSVQAKLEALEARHVALAAELAGSPEEPVRLHPNLAVILQAEGCSPPRTAQR